MERTPQHEREFIELALSTKEPTKEMVEKLCEFLQGRLPKEFSKGKRCKVCPQCSFKCHSRSLKCQNCFHEFRKSQRGANAHLQIQPNDCTLCSNEVLDEDKYVLECGCIYHKQCLVRKARRKFSKDQRCYCDAGRRIPLPDMFFQMAASNQ